MNVSRININGVETSISLGIDENEIEKNENRKEDTIELEKIVDEVKEIVRE